MLLACASCPAALTLPAAGEGRLADGLSGRQPAESGLTAESVGLQGFECHYDVMLDVT